MRLALKHASAATNAMTDRASTNHFSDSTNYDKHEGEKHAAVDRPGRELV